MAEERKLSLKRKHNINDESGEESPPAKRQVLVDNETSEDDNFPTIVEGKEDDNLSHQDDETPKIVEGKEPEYSAHLVRDVEDSDDTSSIYSDASDWIEVLNDDNTEDEDKPTPYLRRRIRLSQESRRQKCDNSGEQSHYSDDDKLPDLPEPDVPNTDFMYGANQEELQEVQHYLFDSLNGD